MNDNINNHFSIPKKQYIKGGERGLKRNWKAGVCVALCSAMVFTGIGPVLTPYLENAVVYADENENSVVKKFFTADQLKVAWGDADYELADGQWKLSFAKQYNQVKWTLPESIEMSQVNAVTFQVADQKVPISLKVYNGGDDATAANTQYGLNGQTEYTCLLYTSDAADD